MVNHYLTTHWPLWPGEDFDVDVWLHMRAHRKMYLDMEPGDCALIYQTFGNPWRRKNGRWGRAEDTSASGCVIAAVELTSRILALNQSDSSGQIHYLDKESQQLVQGQHTEEIDGKSVGWLYVAKTRILKDGRRSKGCTLNELRRALGKSSGWCVRLYDGITEITGDQYRQVFDSI